MKNLFFYSIVVLNLFTSCQNTDCSNGQLDGTETGIDCGGDCPPCVIVDPLSGKIEQVIVKDALDSILYTFDFVYTNSEIDSVIQTYSDGSYTWVFNVENNKAVRRHLTNTNNYVYYETRFYYSGNRLDSTWVYDHIFGDGKNYYSYNLDTMYVRSHPDSTPTEIAYPISNNQYRVEIANSNYLEIETNNYSSLPDIILEGWVTSNVHNDVVRREANGFSLQTNPLVLSLSYDVSGKIIEKVRNDSISWNYIYHQ